MQMTRMRATIPRPPAQDVSMQDAAQVRLGRTAVDAVGSVLDVRTVIPCGSAESDRDIAILPHASRGNEHATRRLFGESERPTGS